MIILGKSVRTFEEYPDGAGLGTAAAEILISGAIQRSRAGFVNAGLETEPGFPNPDLFAAVYRPPAAVQRQLAPMNRFNFGQEAVTVIHKINNIVYFRQSGTRNALVQAGP
jgi:hypothetical protein